MGSACLPACLPARLPACLPACLPARPPARPPACLPACLLVCRLTHCFIQHMLSCMTSPYLQNDPERVLIIAVDSNVKTSSHMGIAYIDGRPSFYQELDRLFVTSLHCTNERARDGGARRRGNFSALDISVRKIRVLTF